MSSILPKDMARMEPAPFDPTDERAVVGRLLLNPAEALPLVADQLSPVLFIDPVARIAFEAICSLHADGVEVSPLTVIQNLRDNNRLREIGGPDAVSRLADEMYCSSLAGLPRDMQRLRDQHAARLTMRFGARLTELAQAEFIDTGAIDAAIEEHAAARRALRDVSDQPRSKWEDVFARGTLTSTELYGLEITPRLPLLSDWLCESDLGFLFAARGVGKTWLALLMAVSIADDKAVGPWKPMGAHPVLYVDGEMPLELIQTRNALLAQAGENLHYINHEWLFDQTGEVLNLTDSECQRAVTALCLEWKIKVLVLDNLSCLFRGVSENDADAWEHILPWLLELRRKKIAVIFIVHAGRNGQMRGTSRREDAAAWVIRLDDATDSTGARTGAKFVSSFTKPSRNTPDNPPPLEWGITTNAGTGEAVVSYAKADGAEAVLGWVRNGLSTCSEIAAEMGVSPGTVSKLATKLIEAGKLKKVGRGYALPDETTHVSEIQ